MKTPCRDGISLMEVLISSFVLSFGLLGVVALLPVGGWTVAQTMKADRCGACGRAAMREAKVRRMLYYGNWTPHPTGTAPSWWSRVQQPTIAPGTAGPFLPSFVIDPLGCVNGLPDTLGPLSRITLISRSTGSTLSLDEADAIFRWPDELLFSDSNSADRRPRRMARDASKTPVVGAYPELPGEPSLTAPLEFLNEGSYTWFITVTPSDAETFLAVAQKSVYSVSVVVSHRATLAASSEVLVNVKNFYGGFGGGELELVSAANVKEGQWILLCGQKEIKPDVLVDFGQWYRVVGAGVSPTTRLSIAGPDWDTTTMLNPTATIVEGVIGVYTTPVAVESDADTLWSP